MVESSCHHAVEHSIPYSDGLGVKKGGNAEVRIWNSVSSVDLGTWLQGSNFLGYCEVGNLQSVEHPWPDAKPTDHPCHCQYRAY